MDNVDVLRVWYFNEDMADGSTSARYYVSEEVCQADFDALEGVDSTHHYNDGFIKCIDFLLEDFEILSIPSKTAYEREYNFAKKLEGFAAWFNLQSFHSRDREDWKDKWDTLKGKGIDDPGSFLDDIIDLI